MPRMFLAWSQQIAVDADDDKHRGERYIRSYRPEGEKEVRRAARYGNQHRHAEDDCRGLQPPRQRTELRVANGPRLHDEVRS